MKYYIILLFLLFSFSKSIGQEKKKKTLKPYKIGLLYNYGTEENFIFDDLDYTYSTNTYKLQAFYKVGKWKEINFDLIVQPQFQFIKHQLINEQYITPDQDNYLEKRDEFTKQKKMNLYGLDFGFAITKRIVKRLDFQGLISLGFNYIDTRTERLASGFTFNENFSLGLSFNIYKNSHLYLGTNFGHVSNLNFQKPNDGYNILGIEIGYSFELSQ
jgi:hypothetical protein